MNNEEVVFLPKFKSFARWPEGTFPAIGDVSDDSHHTLSAAVAVCKTLRRIDNGKGYPLETWVEEFKDGAWKRLSV